jgi:glutathione S-transferase
LEGAEWLVGQRFTVADINTAECVRYAQGHPTLLGEFPAVKAWLARCQARPAFQAMWTKRNAEPV